MVVKAEDLKMGSRKRKLNRHSPHKYFIVPAQNSIKPKSLFFLLISEPLNYGSEHLNFANGKRICFFRIGGFFSLSFLQLFPLFNGLSKIRTWINFCCWSFQHLLFHVFQYPSARVTAEPALWEDVKERTLTISFGFLVLVPRYVVLRWTTLLWLLAMYQGVLEGTRLETSVLRRLREPRTRHHRAASFAWHWWCFRSFGSASSKWQPFQYISPARSR